MSDCEHMCDYNAVVKVSKLAYLELSLYEIADQTCQGNQSKR